MAVLGLVKNGEPTVNPALLAQAEKACERIMAVVKDGGEFIAFLITEEQTECQWGGDPLRLSAGSEELARSMKREMLGLE